jgi:hypothetical protein
MPEDHSELVSWSGGDDPESQEGGSKFTTCWTNGGEYEVVASCGASAATCSVTVVEVEITGEDEFPYLCDGGGGTTLSGHGYPYGGTHDWYIVSGLIELDPNGFWTGVVPTGGSSALNDTEVKVVYTLNGHCCEAYHKMTVLKPTSVTLDTSLNTTFTNGTGHIYKYQTSLKYHVNDQFGDLMDDDELSTADESVSSFCCNYSLNDVTWKHGSGSIAEGCFQDNLGLEMTPYIPSDFIWKINQIITVHDCVIRNNCLFLYFDHGEALSGNCSGDCN